jgi:hypothetical protein
MPRKPRYTQRSILDAHNDPNATFSEIGENPFSQLRTYMRNESSDRASHGLLAASVRCIRDAPELYTVLLGYPFQDDAMPTQLAVLVAPVDSIIYINGNGEIVSLPRDGVFFTVHENGVLLTPVAVVDPQWFSKFTIVKTTHYTPIYRVPKGVSKTEADNRHQDAKLLFTFLYAVGSNLAILVSSSLASHRHLNEMICDHMARGPFQEQTATLFKQIAGWVHCLLSKQGPIEKVQRKLLEEWVAGHERNDSFTIDNVLGGANDIVAYATGNGQEGAYHFEVNREFDIFNVCIHSRLCVRAR